MSQGIDNKAGTINVYELLPEPGDSITVTNVGTHYEVRHVHFEVPPLILTDEEIERMKQGLITWN